MIALIILQIITIIGLIYIIKTLKKPIEKEIITPFAKKETVPKGKNKVVYLTPKHTEEIVKNMMNQDNI